MIYGKQYSKCVRYSRICVFFNINDSKAGAIITDEMERHTVIVTIKA